MDHALFGQQADADAGSGLFVIGDQSGLTSAPTWPHRVQTMWPHSERTGASQSPLIVAPGWQRPEPQVAKGIVGWQADASS
jgi:hypothetical protein